MFWPQAGIEINSARGHITIQTFQRLAEVDLLLETVEQPPESFDLESFMRNTLDFPMLDQNAPNESIHHKYLGNTLNEELSYLTYNLMSLSLRTPAPVPLMKRCI